MTRILLRRWILTGILLVIAGSVSVAAARSLPRTYQAQGSVLLLASHDTARASNGNPWLSFSPSLTLTADAVSRVLGAPATTARLAAQGLRAAYTVALAPETTPTTGSVLAITVTGSDRAGVEATLLGVIHRIPVVLGQLQGHVRKTSRIRAVTLSASLQPSVDVTKSARPVVVVAGPALVLALVIPALVDGYAARRRKRLLAHAAAAGRGGPQDWNGAIQPQRDPQWSPVRPDGSPVGPDGPSAGPVSQAPYPPRSARARD